MIIDEKLIFKVIDDYCSDYDVEIEGGNETPCCNIDDKVIYYPVERLLYPDARDIFDMLHEIGHLKTNTNKMSDFQCEFYATQWAIREIKKYNIPISKGTKTSYNCYMNKFRNKEKEKLNWDA